MALNALNRSFVECEHPVSPWGPKGSDTPNTPKSTMVFCSPFPKLLMSSIAEWCIWGKFAVTKFVVTRFCYVERHGAAPGQNPFALSITKRVDLTVAAWAPVVHLASIEEHVRRENTCVSWHTGWSILSFFIWSALLEQCDFLMGEISDIVHRFDSSSLRWSQNFWIRKHHVPFVRFHFNSGWTEHKIVNFALLLTLR